MAYHPEVQHAIAAMMIELEGRLPHVDRIAETGRTGVDHGGAWPMKLVAAKHHCVESAKRVVDLAMEVSGGTGMFKTNELERLYATCAAAGSTRPTRLWYMKSSARRCSASSVKQGRAGVRRGR